MNDFISVLDNILSKTLLKGDEKKEFNIIGYLMLFLIPIGFIFFIARLIVVLCRKEYRK